MKGAFPPQRPALYAKVFTVLKYRVKRKSQTSYFHLKKTCFFLISGRFLINAFFFILALHA